MNTFEMKTAIHFGDNALDRLKEIPYKRVLIITDPFVVQSKMINLITAPLNSAGIEYDIFHDVVPDAPVDKIAEGGFKSCHPDRKRFSKLKNNLLDRFPIFTPGQKRDKYRYIYIFA